MLLMDRAVNVKLLRASTFTHATEDPGKVRQALLNILPHGLRSSKKLTEEVVKGHHGNEIRIYKLELHGDEALEVLKYVVCSLDESDRRVLLLSISDRVGDVKSHLYIRLGKQEAYMGRLVVRDGSDVVKVSITIDGCRSSDDVSEFLKELIKVC